MAFLYVKAYHGPCTTFNTNVHKPQFLAGLRERLQKLGFRIDLVPVTMNNYCMLEMCGHEVFRCQLKHLKFNTAHDRDVVCETAIEAVMISSVKFRRARAYLWFWTLLDHQLFRRSNYAPQDYWPFEINDIPDPVKPLPKISSVRPVSTNAVRITESDHVII